jgi:hypothetical protein
MNAYFDAFLGRHYFDPEPISTTLKKINCYDLLSSRIQYIIDTESPNYGTVVVSLLQPIQDAMRKLDPSQEKKRVESELGGLFRDLIADLCERKDGFHGQFPNIVQAIQELYQVNKDDFTALDNLIGFNRFVKNITVATPIDDNYRTRKLNWVHKTVHISEIDEWLKYYGLLTEDSNFGDLFIEQNERKVIVPEKGLKRFTLIIGDLIKRDWIKSIGGKGKYKFIQENLKVLGRKKPLSNNYMKQTVDNYTKTGVGEKKHKKTVDSFIEDIDKKSML